MARAERGGGYVNTDRPNIIFILTDDQRADSLRLYGNALCDTPNIDALAHDGVAFSNASVTSAICTPSRATFFSGQYERKHGVNFNSGTSMAPEAWASCYPVLMRDAGYFTGYVGKNHVPIGNDGYESKLIDSSFDYWYAGHKHLTFYPKDRHPIFTNASADTQVEVLEEGAQAFLDADSNEDFLAGAREFLEHRPKDRPFHLSICFNLPHDVGTETMQMLPDDPDVYKTMYRDSIETIPLSPTYVARGDIASPKLPHDVLRDDNRQSVYDYVNTPSTMRERLVRVYQSLTGIDSMVGRIRETLERLGIADHTIIVFTSDHGIMQGDHGLGGKALCYEPCLRIPLIVYDPRLPSECQGRRIEGLVQNIDVAPSMLGWAGVQAPPSMQGRDFTPLIRGETNEWREAAFGENLWSNQFGNPRCESVRTDRWKYIRYFQNETDVLAANLDPADWYTDREDARIRYERWLTASIEGEPPVYEELFDVQRDPLERLNLADDSNHRATLEQMRTTCRRLVHNARGTDGPPKTVSLTNESARAMQRDVKQD